MKESVLQSTISVCPVCLRRIPARYVKKDAVIYMEKACPEHGFFATPVWRGEPDFSEWQSHNTTVFDGPPSCDMNCAACTEHLSPVCCVVLEITERCNLHCPYCLAGAGEAARETLSYEDICRMLDDLYEQGVRSLHLGGGEPTVRDDLLKITAYAAEKGFDYIQLNSNGVRIARETGYAQDLRQAGISSVFLQFDGTTDAIYRKTRGQALLALKEKAIAECDRAFLGTILVPTVVPGVNDGNIGDIVRFAVDRMPAVRGIHFQPVTYMGRIPDEDSRPHITLPELLRAIEEQTGGMIRVRDLYPSTADSSLCGFHGEFTKTNDGLEPLPQKETEGCCACCCSSRQAVNELGEPLDLQGAVARSQKHVRSRWCRYVGEESDDPFDVLLKELHDRDFSISAMAFQDTANLDLKRMMQCTLRVYRNGALAPFCLAHSVTDLTAG